MSLPPIDWNNTRKRILPVAVFCFLALSAVLSGPAHGREIVDMAGRRVSVPDTITKVYGASPPVTYLIYAMDPGLIAGLNHPFTPQEAKYLRPEVKNLPVIGGWFGQGRVPNQETLMQIKPDVMIAWTWGMSAANDKVEQTAKQLGLPLVYIRIDHLRDYAGAFRFMGTLLNREKRGRMLGDYTEKTLKSIDAVVSQIPDSKKRTVYYAEGMDGLSTECDQSPHAELIPMAGAKNIYRCTPRDRYGMEKISMEQVMLYDPEVILAQEKTFAKNVANDPRWQSIRAVRNKNIHLIPRLPFNWFDRPPSFMRILGIQWLTHSLYPDRYPMDVTAETKTFYKLFLGVELDDASLNKVLT
jgi:iron complex transport system substrate-binding protein